MTKQICIWLCSVGFVSSLLVACGEDPQTDLESSPNLETDAVTTAGPSVTVTADKTHAVQPGDEITLTVSVQGLSLDPGTIGHANQPGVGHYRVYLDGASGDDYLAESGAGTTKVVVPDSVTDGSHELRVVLHNNDRTALVPAVEGSVLLIIYRL